jgi:hypothetical protein
VFSVWNTFQDTIRHEVEGLELQSLLETELTVNENDPTGDWDIHLTPWETLYYIYIYIYIS